MSTKYIVNNVTGQTITGDLTINGNVTITGTTNTRPYKVYTALLTQSGGDGNAFIGPGELTIGVTYMINDSFLGQDFTNVGAPNNDVGTWFVATGTIPNSWGVDPENNLIYYPGAPVVTVLENTIGNIWFTYDGVGTYYANSDGLFISNKTYNTPYWYDSLSGDYYNSILTRYISDSIIYVLSYNNAAETSDGFLLGTPIEIRVYN